MKRLAIIAFITCLLPYTGYTQKMIQKELETVQDVDLTRYKGTWYEIARLPNMFERDLVYVTATYTLKKNGKIGVYNQGLKSHIFGKQMRAHGRAKVVDFGKLKVSFFWPFSGDYWILDLDPNYQYVMVGEPHRKYLWILSRTPQLDTKIYDRLLAKALALGFDTPKVTMTLQKTQ